MKNEKTVLENSSLGNERDFRELFNFYRAKVYGYSLKILKSETEAEDVLQDIFLKIWLHKGLGEIDNFEAYLREMTKNQVFKVLRRQNLKLVTDGKLKLKWSESHNETEESLLLNDFQLIINRAIDQLPPKQKLVYTLCKNQGLKYEAAAKILSISPLTVKTHMQHSLRFVRNYLEKHTDVTVLFLIGGGLFSII